MVALQSRSLAAQTIGYFTAAVTSDIPPNATLKDTFLLLDETDKPQPVNRA